MKMMNQTISSIGERKQIPRRRSLHLFAIMLDILHANGNTPNVEEKQIYLHAVTRWATHNYFRKYLLSFNIYSHSDKASLYRHKA